jgi:hypothetical protein
MKRVGRALLLSAVAVSGIGPARAARKSAEPALFGRAPYDAAAVSPHRFSVTLDFKAARQILDALSLEKPKAGDASALLALPAVRRQIEESGKEDSRWMEDFNGAFAAESRPQTFDLRSVRMDRDRWNLVLTSLEQHADRLARLSERRAAALLPAELPVQESAAVQLTFGLPGIADHLVFGAGATGGIVVLVDVARALAAAGPSSLPQGEDSFARLVAAEIFRPAWDAVRSRAAGWKGSETGPADPLARVTATLAPVWLYSYDPDFFPLSEWLHDPMVRAADAFNEEADLLLDPKTELARRAEIVARLERRSLQNDLALAAGPFFADAIYQVLGRDELMKALSSGPFAFLEAYDRAAARKHLPPLSHRLKERLKAPGKAP